MDSSHLASRLDNQEKQSNTNANLTPRSLPDSEEVSIRNGATRITADTQSTSVLPKSFHGMLKTTTETGDIGIFSIKPSRIPQATNSPRSNSTSYSENPQTPRLIFHPHGVPMVDDRRRLPSYAKDPNLGVVAKYGFPRQLPSTRPPPQDSGYRSHSMTQASSYALSNHQSFASLRTQQDSGTLLQRPRSPFAYPTRLRRPGFRPSSPALTDGGLVDYSRRAAIERESQGLGHSQYYPGSVYAQERRLPGTYYKRSEANRSTSSLVSQQSPPRHSSDPNLRQSVGSQSDWARRPVSHSGNASPARSARNLASTVNLYAAPGLVYTNTTPGKIHPPSPLYYDYTEDFVAIDEHDQSERPPPVFQFNRSAPGSEATDVQTIASKVSDSRIPIATSQPALRHSSSVTLTLPRLRESSAIPSREIQEERSHITSSPSNSNLGTTEDFHVELADCKGDSKIVRLSGLGYGARELSTHVEEIFGLPSTHSFGIPVVVEDDNVLENQLGAGAEPSFNAAGFDAMSVESSVYSLGTNLREFPRPLSRQNDSKDLSSEEIDVLEEEIQSHSTASVHSCCSREAVSVHMACDEISTGVETVSRKPFRNSKRYSNVVPLDVDFEELDGFFPPSSDSVKVSQSIQEATYSGVTRGIKLPILPPTKNQIEQQHSTQSTQAHRQSQYQNEGNNCKDQIATHDVVQLPLENDLESSSCFHQSMQLNSISLSESPLIAPKPVSPARQLRLRYSIPQIMKALPPLPLDHPSTSAGPLANKLPSLKSEHQLSLMFVGVPSSPTSEPQKTPLTSPIRDEADVKKVTHEERLSGDLERKSAMSEEDPTTADLERSAPMLSRFKLKARNSNRWQPSPPDARPFNMAESYPWSSRSVNVKLPHLESEAEPARPEPPKFKLKVTRASTSSQGTMIVNRDSSDSKGLRPLHLQSTKDLFAPAAGLDSIFRHVGRHIHTKSSENSRRSGNHQSTFPSPISEHTFTTQIEEAVQPQPKQQKSYTAMILVGTQSSFSDDSSHTHNRRNLRTRLSNLRARMPFHYAYRNATRSSDDIGWGRRSEEPRSSNFLRSAPDLHLYRAALGPELHTEVPGSVQRVKLRTKLRGWLQGVKTAISGHRLPRSSTSKKRDDDVAQLN